MKTVWYKGKNNKRLVVFCAGWGMDETIFGERGIATDGADGVMVYDYATPEGCEREKFAAYDDVRLVGWSFGVGMGERLLKTWGIVPRHAVAVCGTREMVDERYGIRPDMAEATEMNLTAQSLQKFYLRMCGGKAAYERFRNRQPRRSLESLRAELHEIRRVATEKPQDGTLYRKAIVGSGDRIFLPEAVRAAWAREDVAVEERDMAHYDEAVIAEIIAEMAEA